MGDAQLEKKNSFNILR